MKVKATQSCLTLCNSMDYIVHVILQARILEWVAFPFSRRSSQPRDWTQVSRITGRFLTIWVTWEARFLSWEDAIWAQRIGLVSQPSQHHTEADIETWRIKAKVGERWFKKRMFDRQGKIPISFTESKLFPERIEFPTTGGVRAQIRAPAVGTLCG